VSRMSINAEPNQRALRAGLWALILLLMPAGSGYAAGRASQASSSGPVREIRLGVAKHDVNNLWSRSSKEKGEDLIGEVIFNYPLFRLLSAEAYPNVGFSLNTRGYTSKVYGGFLVRWVLASPFFFSAGLGLTVHNGKLNTDSPDRKSLGSRVLFRIPIELGIVLSRHHLISLAFDHMSNAGLASPNQGLDTVGVVYTYHF
jgi:lipid A 3-O-deacylase